MTTAIDLSLFVGLECQYERLIPLLGLIEVHTVYICLSTYIACSFLECEIVASWL